MTTQNIIIIIMWLVRWRTLPCLRACSRLDGSWRFCARWQAVARSMLSGAAGRIQRFRSARYRFLTITALY